jgi:hypothetical protein
MPTGLPLEAGQAILFGGVLRLSSCSSVASAFIFHACFSMDRECRKSSVNNQTLLTTYNLLPTTSSSF